MKANNISHLFFFFAQPSFFLPCILEDASETCSSWQYPHRYLSQEFEGPFEAHIPALQGFIDWKARVYWLKRLLVFLVVGWRGNFFNENQTSWVFPQLFVWKSPNLNTWGFVTYECFRLELAGKTDKAAALRAETDEAIQKADELEMQFARLSDTIRGEVARWEFCRILVCTLQKWVTKGEKCLWFNSKRFR